MNDWNYENPPSRGKKLKQLAPSELLDAIPKIQSALKFVLSLDADKQNLFKAIISQDFKYQQQVCDHLIDAITDIQIFSKQGKLNTSDENIPDDHPVHWVNKQCGLIFSDDGWKYVRKLINQSNNRKKAKRIHLADDVLVRFENYMAQHKLKVPSDAIDQLLADSLYFEQLEDK